VFQNFFVPEVHDVHWATTGHVNPDWVRVFTSTITPACDDGLGGAHGAIVVVVGVVVVGVVVVVVVGVVVTVVVVNDVAGPVHVSLWM
jgi:hypothetical protein